ncbi:uncharacterized protein BN815_01231 [Firmicutes bacterium CAG:94]|nr:uncharacterized protein BN815_01231 [Firmicutes bacterium CAG:94]
MKRDGVYRFNLQFPADTQEHIRVGEVLERLGKRKSSLVVAALAEYLDRNPQWETPEVRVKIEQQSAMSREKLEELVRRLVEEKLASLPVSSQEADPAVEEELDSDISQMLENLELFQS